MFYLENNERWDAIWRGRYQLQVQSPDFGRGLNKKYFALTSFEILDDLSSSVTDTFGDRFRYNLGIGRRVNSGLRVELNYLFHRFVVNEQSQESEYDDHALRLRFFYYLN
jgi:hypothetical protein